MIVATTTSGLGAKLLPDIHTHILWYAKNRESVRYRQLYWDKEIGGEGVSAYTWVELSDGTRRRMTTEEQDDVTQLPAGARPYRVSDLTSQEFRNETTFEYDFDGSTFHPGANRHWQTTRGGLERLAAQDRLQAVGRTLGYVRFLDDFGGIPMKNVWTDMGRAGFGERKRYVVETVPKLIARCALMTTDPGDLVFDPTCGAGTTAYVAEQYGRRWITCDTSRVAVSIARERLLTSTFAYYALDNNTRGVDAGFKYRILRWVTLRSLAYDYAPDEVPLVDQPLVDAQRIRVSGPFTVEALSRYAVNPNQENVPPEPDDPQASEPQDHVRTLLDALTRQGIPRRGGKPAKVLRVEPLASAGALNAEGIFEAEDGSERSFAVSVGPRFGPITVQQIDEALRDSYGYDLVVFAGYAATAEAQQYVAKGKLGRFDVALLEANPDLLVADLLKQTPSSQTFRLFAAPDIKLNTNGDGDHTVEVLGVDVFDAATGETRFVGDEYVAAWFLDTDYDGLVFHVNQAFFPDGGWEKLAKTLKGTVDPELIEQLERFESLPFRAREHRKAAVRVIDDAGTTSEVVLDL
jgi:adenine-specific DNA-methyltransferase